MPNKLIDEQSPYLLQHAHNPVNWYPWGDEAFIKASAEHKPVIVSIGYAACHWCHVMEKESFEDPVAGGVYERTFCMHQGRPGRASGRRPFVYGRCAGDQWQRGVAAQCFVTPDRAPFYGGTYYPPVPAFNRPSWKQLLQRMNDIWHNQQDEVAMQAGQMLQHLRQASLSTAGNTGDITSGICHKIADNLLNHADREHGGFGNAPKFPGTMAISYLLEHYHFTGYDASLKHALLSLDAMIAGGIYDQLAGGFARYSTDRSWLAPHFEKMLYDNALLIGCLCDAYSITGDARYGAIIEQTIEFADRELKDGSGGYYCALDADSEGVEGKFYTWTWDEWLEASGDVDGIAQLHFGISPEGNWEHTNILHIAMSVNDVAIEKNRALEEIENIVAKVKENLLAVRISRVRPATDDKCLLSWNALMNISLCKAATVLSGITGMSGSGARNYLAKAIGHMEWMINSFELNGALLHTWKNGVAKIPAKLDDYAYLIQALLQLASATGENKWLTKAAALCAVVVRNFSREDGFFYYTPEGQKDMPVRKVDLYDGATPSANAVMAHNLWVCGMGMERSEWVQRTGFMLNYMAGTAARHSYSFGYWSVLLQRHIAGMKTVICTGTDADKIAAEIRAKYFPQAFLLTCQKEIFDLPILEKKFFDGKLYIFVCSEQACLSPVSSVDEAFNLINQ